MKFQRRSKLNSDETWTMAAIFIYYIFLEHLTQNLLPIIRELRQNLFKKVNKKD